MLKKKSNLLKCCLALSASGFAAEQDTSIPCKQGEPLSNSCRYLGSYNTPAAVDLNSSLPVNFFVDASFTYWYAKEDGLGIGESAILSSTGRTFNSLDGENLTQSAEYQPGFKVGIGSVLSHQWTLEANYTWFRSKTTTSEDAPQNSSDFPGTGVWNMDDWFLQTTSITSQSLTGSHITSNWNLSMDLGDVSCSRPFYVGTRVLLTPLAGLRTVWIRQKMNIDLTQVASSVGGAGNLTAQPINSYTTSHSWGIGPRLGFEGSLLLPKGIRFDGMFATSLLYTQFSSINHQEERFSLLVLDSSLKAHMKDFSAVRPIAEVGLGMGWGTYLCNKSYHIDFSASYDFSYFWGQNVMRQMLDQFWAGTASGSNDLYFHGLTLTTQFNF